LWLTPGRILNWLAQNAPDGLPRSWLRQWWAPKTSVVSPSRIRPVDDSMWTQKSYRRKKNAIPKSLVIPQPRGSELFEEAALVGVAGAFVCVAVGETLPVPEAGDDVALVDPEEFVALVGGEFCDEVELNGDITYRDSSAPAIETT
jgi:hypothetical protein